MSGRRHHDGEPGPTLGKHLKAELAGILRLLLKNAARHSAPLLGSPAWTAFQTGFRADYASVLPEAPTVRVSPNAVSFAASANPMSGPAIVPLLSPDTARLRRDAGRPTATPHRMPVFSVTDLSLKRLDQIDFSSPPDIRKKELLTGASQGSARILRIPITTTMTKRLPVRLSATRHDVALLSHPARPRNDARMLALPIRKAPVPLHRFPLEMRQRFRQALAEKAGLPPDQIQLLRVFDRLIPDRYAAIRQDEQGILLCTPKSRDLVLDKDDRERRRFASQGRRALRTSLPSSVETGVFYLVIGLRLDTRRELRALVSPAREGAS